ncbi:MAG: CapA family protein [Legionella longbeachae]|nr:CapA family protein [Legionella longbeachae]
MKKVILALGTLIFLFLIVYLYTSHKSSFSLNQQNHPESSFSERPKWAQWRAEGMGIVKFFTHFLEYKKKSETMVLNPFPGQKAFFAEQKKLLANLPQPLESQHYVKVGFVGDLMQVPNVKERFIASEVLTFLQNMDFVLGNLETPISPSSSISKFREYFSQYNVPITYLDALSINGKPVIQFLALANNHILDRGDLGVQETIKNVQDRGILVQGADEKKLALFVVKGISFGVASATWGVNPQLFQNKVNSHIWYLNGIAPLDKNKISLHELKNSLIEMKKQGVDFKILFLHWGFEFETFPDPMIQEIGRELIQAGADLIIGSHPHVLQPFELVQTENHKGLIAYSMGNFVTDMVNPFYRIGLIQELKVWLNAHKKVEWSLGVSRFTQINDIEHPQTAFATSTPSNDLADVITYYRKSLNLPFLQ